MSRYLIAAAIVTLAASAYGAAPDATTSRPFLPADAAQPARDYVIDPPDEIILHCPGKAEFDNQRRKVGPEGTIPLPLIGEVLVGGLSTDSCVKLLREKVGKYYVDPQLTIEVIDNSKFYYVFGQGAPTPGPQVCTGHDTVVQAVVAAGVSADAWPAQVWISRPPMDGKGRAAQAVVDFKRLFEQDDLSQNLVLEAGDILTIPASPLGALKTDLKKFLAPTTNPSTFGPSQVIVRPGKAGR